MARTMLTTFDNPFNPFKQFEQWLLFDAEKGYDSCGFVGRVARTSDQFSDAENDQEIERAIDNIIKYDFTNMYKKIKETDEKT